MTAKNLVIVESPTKAKILKKILGRQYAVESSGGHIRDLPEKADDIPAEEKKLPWAKLGVDVEHDFQPLYVSNPTKKKTVAKLRELVGPDTVLYLATDEDREGEAIAWHLNELLDPERALQTWRVVFHEITPAAITEAFKHPRALDMDRVYAQQARRVLDRLVGYKLSPLLWKKIRFGLSAGRVQSAAVRIVVDREREIQAFKPEEYWTIGASFSKDGVAFEAVLGKRENGASPASQAEADAILARVRDADFTVEGVERKEVRRNPPAPFTTSTLQQEASRKLGFAVKRTMRLAQQLYEGVDLKDGAGPSGLITYMRTDSVNLSTLAQQESRRVLGELYGPEYQLKEPRTFQTKSKSAQEAHEAIRPTDLGRKPDSLRGLLEEDQRRLYELIWMRTLACQAPQAVLDAVGANLVADGLRFRATGQRVRFPGFTRIYEEGSDLPERGESRDRLLPDLAEGERLRPLALDPRQHFTKPPPRYTEAALVRRMEEEGIGRPSTYAPTVSTIQARGYATLDGRALVPTDTAFVVNDFLVKHFDQVVDLQFTAGMENDLDAIAAGEKKWVPFLHGFYGPFARHIEEKDKTIKKSEVVSEPTDEVCEQCGKPMVIKLGRMGRFLSCSAYPDCKHAKPIGGEDEGLKALKEQHKDETCPECQAAMTVRRSRFGPFLSCSRYPACKKTVPIVVKTGVTCPMCNQGGIVEKRGKRGPFWGCDRYPACDYISRFKPVRPSDDGRPGFYAERGGKEFFAPFDAEAYAARRRKKGKAGEEDAEAEEAVAAT